MTDILTDLFGSLVFQAFFLPLFAAALGVFVRAASRNDRFSSFAKEDFAVGFELALVAIIGFVAYGFFASQELDGAGEERAEHLRNKIGLTPWMVLAWVLGLWGISTAVRKLGWRTEREMHLAIGIVGPILYGLVLLIVLVVWIGD